MRKLRPYTRWLYELLFAINCTALYVFGNTESDAVSRILSWVYTLSRFLESRFHWRILGGHNDPTPFYIAWGGLALAVFLCLRLLGRFAISGMFLRYVSPVLVIAGPLYRDFYFGDEPHQDAARWLGLEIAVMATVLLVFQHRKRTTAATLGFLVLLLLHFWFWLWLHFYPELDWWLATNPRFVLPFCTILAWGLWVGLSTKSDASVTPR